MKYFFIGIKGAGMSSLAQIMFDLGYDVSGSDKDKYYFTEDGLVKRGIKIYNFDENNIKEGMIIVQGNAFNDENVEVKKAKELNLKIYTYQEMINEVSKNQKLIAISGCHGKTSTTNMISRLFENVGINYLIGDGTGSANKNNKIFALEACEWKRHFLEYKPYYSIITNVELDHTDYYKNTDDVIDAFTTFANNAKYYCIMCGDDENTRKIKTSTPTFFYGFNDNNNLVIKNKQIKGSHTIADLYIDGQFYGKFEYPFVGDHLILNATAAISVAYLEKLDVEEIKKQVKLITPARRRFIEQKFLDNILIDDYAHHPTEIRVTIEAAKAKYPGKFIVAVFKAHTRSRVGAFKKEFGDALNLADKCYVMDIGEDRIEHGYDVTYKDILKNTRNGEYINLDSVDKLLQYHNSVIIFMSSKDIYYLTDAYKKLASK